MRLQDSFTIAWRGVRHAGMRSLLTMLGIVIGISSVIILMSIGQSAQDYILGQVQGIGSNLIMVAPNSPNSSKNTPPSAMFGVVIKTIKDRDVEALRREPSVAGVGVENHGQDRAVYGDTDVSLLYTGVNGDYSKIVELPTEQGVWFNDADVDAMAHVAVIGPKLSKDLFGDNNPIGKSFRVKNITFQVIGVLESKGSFIGANVDNMAFFPSSVVHRQLLGIDYYGGLVVKANDEYAIDFVRQRIISVLRANHGITDPSKDDFMLTTMDELINVLGNITSILSIFLSAIAAISLVVGGIGIMNIMLVTVVERTKEIGLRKAVGASNRDIMIQFLWEALMLTMAGGFVGVVLGAMVTFVVYVMVNHLGGIVWPFALPLSAIIMAAVVSSFIGLVFGLYPARAAARKNPIDALHYE
jgi:putative ABC transport system permease protein